ncbi:MAG: hypothetical protein Q4A70_03785 [Candidatus Saccharibacteria bacterium]|nr:hypothetical protein [Candidatus Saccharibacteria bacterium]
MTDGESKNKRSQVKSKGEFGWLKTISFILIAAIVVLGGINIWLMLARSGAFTSESEKIKMELETGEIYDKVSLYSFDNEAEGYDEYIDYLEGIIDNSVDLDNAITARHYLTTIKVNNQEYDEAARILDGGLNDARLDDQNKYWLLEQYLWLYSRAEDINGEIRILEKLIELPDDLEVEGANWMLEKPVRKEELEEKQRLVGENGADMEVNNEE